MGAQGYDIKKNILFQYNQISIKMIINGRNLCTGKSRHTNIHYLFSKDRVESNKMSI